MHDANPPISLRPFAPVLNFRLPIIYYDASGSLRWCNQEFLNTFGYLKEDIAQLSLGKLIVSPLIGKEYFEAHFMQPGSFPGMRFRLKSGLRFLDMASRIGYVEANCYSMRVNAYVSPLPDNTFLCCLVPEAEHIHSVVHRAGLFSDERYLILDENNRILDYDNQFFLQFRDLGKAHFFGMDFKEFFEDSDWRAYQNMREQAIAKIRSNIPDAVEPFSLLWHDPFTHPTLRHWNFDKNGTWEIGQGILNASVTDHYSYAVSSRSAGAFRERDLRMEFWFRCPGSIFFSCFFGLSKNIYSLSPDEGGYSFSVSQDSKGSSAMLKKGLGHLQSAAISPLIANQWYHVAAEKCGGRISLYINDARVAEIFDIEPILSDQPLYPGLCCSGQMQIRDFKTLTRRASLNAREIPPHVTDIRLKGYPHLVFSMQVTRFEQFERPAAIIRLKEVSPLRKMETHLKSAQKSREELRNKNFALRWQLAKPEKLEPVGNSESIRRLKELVKQMADSDASVLITGETGTGKDLLAHYLHRAGSRSDLPFIKIDCAALPPALLESELFGHDKGAFTGAYESKAGRFEAAGSGTVFLDEISNLDPLLQAKLLRVLQDRVFERIGGKETLQTKARIITASNENLEKLIRRGRFREDLFYRINVVNLHLPPLRERKEDIPALTHFLLEQICLQNQIEIPGLSSGFMDALMSQAWPGNIRELRNTLERTVLLHPNTPLAPDMLRSSGNAGLKGKLPVKTVLPRNLTRAQISETIETHRHNLSAAAKSLGITRQSLYRVLQTHGVQVPARASRVFLTQSRRQTILKWLIENNAKPALELAAHFRVSLRTVTRDLELLIKGGQIEKLGNGPGTRYKAV